MSKIILEGFRADTTITNDNATLLKTLLWFDKVTNKLKVGNKNLNYYVDPTGGANSTPIKVLTLMTQDEDKSKVILPVEFSVLS